MSKTEEITILRLALDLIEKEEDWTPTCLLRNKSGVIVSLVPCGVHTFRTAMAAVAYNLSWCWNEGQDRIFCTTLKKHLDLSGISAVNAVNEWNAKGPHSKIKGDVDYVIRIMMRET